MNVKIILRFLLLNQNILAYLWLVQVSELNQTDFETTQLRYNGWATVLT